MAEVGHTIVSYLRNSRPTTAERRLFVRHYGTEEGASDAILEGVFKSFAQEMKDQDARARGEAYIKWARGTLRNPRLVEAAELFLCKAWYRQRAYEAALEALAEFRKQYPGSGMRFKAELLEGLIYMRTEKKEQALKVFANISARTEGDPVIIQKAMFLIGWAHIFDQDYEKARPALANLARRFPNTQYADKASGLLERLPGKEGPGTAH